MNLEAMPAPMQAIHRDGPLRGRFVTEIEILVTDHGVIAEAMSRGRTWTHPEFHASGDSIESVVAQVGAELARLASERGE